MSDLLERAVLEMQRFDKLSYALSLRLIDLATTLEAQLAADRADAERYRWWVKHCWFYRGPRCLQETGALCGEIGVGEGQTKKQSIDAAVDAAIQATAPEQEGE